MVSHVVIFKPRDDLSADQRLALVGALERAVGAIPSIRAIRVGRRVTHGAGYEPQTPDMDFMVMIDFDDLAALQAYLRHPAHGELGDRFNQSITSALIYDFEAGGVEELRRLA